MAINSTYYLDAADLTLATAVYLDLALTLIAPDGFYGDGTITREQSAGILLAEEVCADCPIPCDISLSDDLLFNGIYTANINMGTEVSSTGAMVIKFTTSYPIGVRVTFDSIVYNKINNEDNGIHQSTTSGNYTFVGDEGFDGGCDWSSLPVTSTLNKYLYSGGAWVGPTGTESLTVNSGDISLNSVGSDTATYYMVIPKPTLTPDLLKVEIAVTCDLAFSSFEIFCPTPLTPFSSSVKQATNTMSCSLDKNQTFYCKNLSVIPLQLNDYVFSDINGEFPLEDGWYLTDRLLSEVIGVENGIITGFNTCVI